MSLVFCTTRIGNFLFKDFLSRLVEKLCIGLQVQYILFFETI